MITMIILFTVIGMAFSLVFSILAFMARITWGLFRVLLWPIAAVVGILFVAGWFLGTVFFPAALVALAILGVLFLTRDETP